MEGKGTGVERKMKGKVYLVGAGPGDPKLLTLRASELVQKADVVLYDRLVGRRILRLAPGTAIVQYVGRAAGDPTENQDNTNNLMIHYAKSHRTIVRLKGGDPTIFGRGGEEAEFLKSHKVKYEIVPGITSAVAAATYSGIPLTHRTYSSSVAFVTGHEDPQKKQAVVNWKNLAGSADTIVVMMGLSGIGRICRQLVAGGMDKKTPVAVIQHATTPRHATITGNASNIAARVRKNKVESPAVIIIGDVVSLGDTISWR